jgi:hypothetical protein
VECHPFALFRQVAKIVKPTRKYQVGLEVCTAMIKKSSIFWDITLKINPRSYRLHLQRGRVSQARNQDKD